MGGRESGEFILTTSNALLILEVDNALAFHDVELFTIAAFVDDPLG